MRHYSSSPTPTPAPALSRRERFLAGFVWLILKNLIGWTLILMSLAAGPLVPGPGGIPLFLIGFALITFPGKRRLTARVLRGRRIRLRGRAVVWFVAGLSLVVPALVVWLAGMHLPLFDRLVEHGQTGVVAAYVIGVVATAVLAFAAILLVNLLILAMPPIRRRIRPWLRSHRIRLLPPRWRHRLPHEPGSGPLRLKDEILSFLKRPQTAGPGND